MSKGPQKIPFDLPVRNLRHKVESLFHALVAEVRALLELCIVRVPVEPEYVEGVL